MASPTGACDEAELSEVYFLGNQGPPNSGGHFCGRAEEARPSQRRAFHPSGFSPSLPFLCPKESLHGSTDPRSPSRVSRLSIAQKMQAVICRVAASASEWCPVHSLALAATEKSRVQRTLGSLSGRASRPSLPLRRMLLSLRCPLRLGAFRRSTPIRLHRRDATGTQRKPCCVAVLSARLVMFGRSSKQHSLALAATGSQKLK